MLLWLSVGDPRMPQADEAAEAAGDTRHDEVSISRGDSSADRAEGAAQTTFPTPPSATSPR